ncbi:cytochrome P450 [Mycena galopus ATCC 62051]|nr:cytochrome P450 [Mycena galopus ATCC 62051]
MPSVWASYTIHRNPAIWSANVEAFQPERWSEGSDVAKAAREKTFNPFSVGLQVCVGRNLASLELQIIVVSILRRYDFVLGRPDMELEMREGKALFMLHILDRKLGKSGTLGLSRVLQYSCPP